MSALLLQVHCCCKCTAVVSALLLQVLCLHNLLGNNITVIFEIIYLHLD